MRRFAPAYAKSFDDEPLGSINITPLIDVLLVLLVMIILTIPIMAHEVPMDLPQPGPKAGVPPVIHRLAIARSGAVSLDGRAVTGGELPGLLAAVRADRQAVLVMKTDPEARYERFVETIAVVKRAGITRLGFEGERGE